MNANDFLGGNYINKDTLATGPQRFLVTEVETATFTTSGKPEKRLQLVLDDEKRLTLNSTNTRLLIKAFGADTSRWIGQRITLYLDESVTFRGQPVGGVRVAIPKKAPTPPPPPADFDDPFGPVADTPDSFTV